MGDKMRYVEFGKEIEVGDRVLTIDEPAESHLYSKKNKKGTVAYINKLTVRVKLDDNETLMGGSYRYAPESLKYIGETIKKADLKSKYDEKLNTIANISIEILKKEAEISETKVKMDRLFRDKAFLEQTLKERKDDLDQIQKNIIRSMINDRKGIK